jgi:hypothetical protein
MIQIQEVLMEFWRMLNQSRMKRGGWFPSKPSGTGSVFGEELMEQGRYRWCFELYLVGTTIW